MSSERFLSWVSVMIAVLTLIYSTWRFEVTERNQNLRVAGFVVLYNLGELQLIVNQSYSKGSDPIQGWGRVALISDLSMLLSPSVQTSTHALLDTWKQEVGDLGQSDAAAQRISEAIDKGRQSVLNDLRFLK